MADNRDSSWRERRLKMIALSEEGKTTAEIGEMFGIQRSRVSHLIRSQKAADARLRPYDWMNDLSVRASNVLTNQGIKTLNQACQLTENQLLAMPNCGKGTVIEIRKLCSL